MRLLEHRAAREQQCVNCKMNRVYFMNIRALLLLKLQSYSLFILDSEGRIFIRSVLSRKGELFGEFESRVAE